MKAIFTSLLIFCSITFTLAQSDMQDVIYLKNGSIFKGYITEQVPGDFYKIQLSGGSLFVVKAEEVEKIMKEKIDLPKVKAVQEKHSTSSVDFSAIKKKGYASNIELGILPSNDGDGTGYMFSTFQGHKYNDKNALGFTTGLQFLGFGEIIIPALLDFRVTPIESVFSPQIIMQGGYGLNFSDYHGLMVGVGIGAKYFYTERNNLLFNLSYNIQNLGGYYVNYVGVKVGIGFH